MHPASEETRGMEARTLAEKVRAAGDPVAMLRNAPVGAYVYPMPSEVSNWRDEQHAWRETAVLFDQSFHMTDVYFEGPDVLRLLSETGVNRFEGFGPDRAKQFVACSPDGYVIGDAILFGLAPERVSLVGRPCAANWLEFQVSRGGYDVRVERDERAAVNPRGRRTFRFQVQGPAALKVLEEVNGGPLPEIGFFRMGEIGVGDLRVRALHHGMSGAPGLELWGPAEHGAEVKAALVEAGGEFGLREAGARAYSTNTLESGWIPSPMPAVYSGAAMRAYREWLPAQGFEANASLGGSYDPPSIEDYYLTPQDLGYGRFVDYGHDFIGRDALQAMARPHRRKVTLEWDSGDVMKVIASQFEHGERVKYLDWPASNYATLPYDRVTRGGGTVGISTFSGYSSNERCWLSLAMVDEAVAEPGTQVTLVWGEAGGGTAKPTVERHRQAEIRAVVSPVPYSRVAREEYRPAHA
jgi:glycine cleavage system aminomethyltransferase T